jgi:hypothetical protein
LTGFTGERNPLKFGEISTTGEKKSRAKVMLPVDLPAWFFSAALLPLQHQLTELQAQLQNAHCLHDNDPIVPVPHAGNYLAFEWNLKQ